MARIRIMCSLLRREPNCNKLHFNRIPRIDFQITHRWRCMSEANKNIIEADFYLVRCQSNLDFRVEIWMTLWNTANSAHNKGLHTHTHTNTKKPSSNNNRNSEVFPTLRIIGFCLYLHGVIGRFFRSIESDHHYRIFLSEIWYQTNGNKLRKDRTK